MAKAEIRMGHALDVLRTMADNSVHCCVTSPPYWGLRAYGTEPQDPTWVGGFSGRHARRGLGSSRVRTMLRRSAPIRRKKAPKRSKTWTTAGAALPKPCDRPRDPEPAVHVFPDGRERCGKGTAGRAEYRRRTEVMWRRQRGRCLMCNQQIPKEASTFDHENGRQVHCDERLYVRDPETGCLRRQNACLCWQCNGRKGSRHGYGGANRFKYRRWRP